MPKSKGLFYAVKRGSTVGVYSSWEECERNVKGISGAIYKKFRTIEEAEAFIGLNSSATERGAGHPPGYQDVSRIDARSSTPRPSLRGRASPFLRDRGGAPASTSQDNTRTDHPKRESAVNNVSTDPTHGREEHIAYTDGACSSNGKPDAAAGIGVWWGSLDSRNLSERCPGRQANNRAEIYAIIRLLETAPTGGGKSRLIIKTDSKYAVNCARNWASKWEENGWMKSTGEEVKDAGMIQYLLALLSLRATQGELIVFNHVRGHSGDAGNEAADALARGGTTKPPLPDRDWPAEKLRVDELMRPKTTPPSPFTWRILKDHFEFVIEEGDLLSFEELEELEKTQAF